MLSSDVASFTGARLGLRIPHVISSAYEDIARDGIFPKDPDLQAFLKSSAAVAAGLASAARF